MGVMKIASILVGIVVALYSILLLVQVWGVGIPIDTFIKITFSAVVLVVVIFGLAMLYREYVFEKKMSDEGYVD
jgi:hypothetical protein